MKVVFIGRFQPIHLGHHRTIKRGLKDHDEFVVGLGSPEKSGTRENPLTAEQRESLIKACFPDVEIVRIEDEDRGPEGFPDWIDRVRRKTEADALLTGNRIVQEIVRESEMELLEVEKWRPGLYSGSKVRARIREDGRWRELVPGCAVKELEQLTDRFEPRGNI